VDEVFPVTLGDVERAKNIVLGKRRLSARDALHAAVMGREGIEQIMSFDSGSSTACRGSSASAPDAPAQPSPPVRAHGDLR
jgi:predicted nucleic acid-binding protein